MQTRLEERDQKELRRQQAEEKEDEKILRMEKRVSGVTIDTSLGQRKPVRKRSDDVHEIILEQEPDTHLKALFDKACRSYEKEAESR